MTTNVAKETVSARLAKYFAKGFVWRWCKRKIRHVMARQTDRKKVCVMNQPIRIKINRLPIRMLSQ